MLKDRRAAAMKVAESLFAAEQAIDLALARAAELTGAMVSARTDANLSAIVGQEAFEVSAAAFAALARARADIVETHKRLSEAQVQIGLRTVSFGDQGKPLARDRRHLQIVA
jgi:ABC-type sugar transport system substrate-binding protein